VATKQNFYTILLVDKNYFVHQTNYPMAALLAPAIAPQVHMQSRTIVESTLATDIGNV
jgi:hypothetical protein